VEWQTKGNRPDWNMAQGFSRPEMAYWNKYESLLLGNRVIYQIIAIKTEADEEFKQILMPNGHKNEFLDSIHKDLTGHLGNTNTTAHVLRRAYWFNWK